METKKIICIACEVRIAEHGEICNQCCQDMNEAMTEIAETGDSFGPFDDEILSASDELFGFDPQ